MIKIPNNIIVLQDCWQDPVYHIKQNEAYSESVHEWTYIERQHRQFYTWLSKELERLRPQHYDIVHNSKNTETSELLSNYEHIGEDQYNILSEYNHIYIAGCHLNRCVENYAQNLQELGLKPSVILNWCLAFPNDNIQLLQKVNYSWCNVPNAPHTIKKANKLWLG